MLRQASSSLLRAPVALSLAPSASSAAAAAAARPALAVACWPAASSVACAAPNAWSLHTSRRGFAAKAPAKGGAKGGKGGKDSKGKDDAAAKAKKKKKKVGQAGDTRAAGHRQGDMSGLEEMLEQQLNLPKDADPRTPAELALDVEYAKEHSRRLMAAHKLRLKAEHNFLKSRWVAINALPAQLRKHALVEDLSQWPKNFQPIPWTPAEYAKRFGNSGRAIPEDEQQQQQIAAEANKQ